MPKRRTSNVQHRERASDEALNRRLGEGTGSSLPDWRLLVVGGALVAGVLVLALVMLFGGGSADAAGVAQPNDGSEHTSDGADCRHAPGSCDVASNPYSSLPATSGPHWVDPAEWGVYTTPAQESQVIHNLEHGGIVIWYDPARVDGSGVAKLADYVNEQVAAGISGRFKFILSPWGGSDPLPSAVVATAWRYLLELDTPDTGAITEFARAHYGKSPEPNGGPGPPSG